jgi:hypothetical protein
MGDVLAIRASASWVKITVTKAPFALVNLTDRLDRIRSHGDDYLFKHSFRLGGRTELGVLSKRRSRCDCGNRD